jgi:DeoR family transcriptional regulator, aga operon transcriptional repressor
MQSPRKHNEAEPEALDIDQRREKIAAMVNAEHFVSVQDLARMFGVSQVTIRADIDALSKERKGLRRVRGGIMRGQAPYAETPYEARSRAQAEDKAAIGHAAAAMVQSNDTILLDVGTTTMAIAEALVQRADLSNVTVFTNGLNLALTLERAYPRIQTVVTGGSLRPLQHSLVEPMATLVLERIRAGIAFIGCNGIDPDFGISTTNLPEAAIKQVIMRAALRVVIVADGSKFGRSTLARICGVEEVDSFLTAGHVDTSCAMQLKELGIEIVNARPVD